MPSPLSRDHHHPAQTRSLARLAICVGVLLVGAVAWAGRGPNVQLAMSVLPDDPTDWTMPHPSASRGPDCTGCHTPDAEFSHPVGVIPSMPIPSDMPLVEGKIACITCHADTAAMDHGGGRPGRPAMRSESRPDGQFCLQCHIPDGGSKSLHGMMPMKAHLRWRQNPSEMQAPASQAFNDSRDCLSCHDGSIASDIGSTSHGRTSHPVEIRYRSKGIDRLVPMSMLDERVRLFDGEVGCQSCHSLYSSQRGLLVMNNTGSRLCYSCHDMK